jgi:hypothetical protein
VVLLRSFLPFLSLRRSRQQVTLSRVMTEADSILAGERSRNRPDRIVNAFAPGYVIAESDETKNNVHHDLHQRAWRRTAASHLYRRR